MARRAFGGTAETGAPARETLHGAGLVFLSEALILPTGLITLALLTRRLGTNDYGLFTLASTTVTWIEWSITAVFGRAANQCIAQEKDWGPAATTTLQLRVLTGIVAAVLLAAAAGPLAALFGEPRLASHLRLFALDIPIFSAAQAHRDILVGLGGFRGRAALSAIRWLARLALLAGVMALGFGIEGAIWASIATSVAELAFARRMVRPKLFERSGYPAARLIAYAAPLLVFAVSVRLFGRLDLFVLKALGATAAVAGEYGVAQNLAVFPALLTLALAPLLQSTLVRLQRDRRDEEARVLARDGLRLVTLLLPFLALAAGSAREIVVFVAGPAYAAAGPLFAWLAFAALGSMMTGVAAAILVAAERLRATSAVGLLVVTLQFGGLLWAVPRYGAVGAAAVTACCACLGAFVALVLLARFDGITLPASSALRAVVLAPPAFLVSARWWPAGPFVLVKLGALAVVVAVAFVLFGEVGAKDRVYWK